MRHLTRTRSSALIAASLFVTLTSGCGGARSPAAAPGLSGSPCSSQPFWTAERRSEVEAGIRSLGTSWSAQTSKYVTAEMDQITATQAGICQAMVAQKAPPEVAQKVGLCLRSSVLQQAALYQALKRPPAARLANVYVALAMITDGTGSCQKDAVWQSYDGELTDERLFKAQELSAIAEVARTLDDERAEEASALASAAAELSGSKNMRIAALLSAALFATEQRMDYQRAKALASQAFTLADGAGQQFPRALAQQMLARIATSEERYTEAEALYQGSIKTLEVLLGKESLLIAETIHALGQLEMAKGRYRPALVRHEQATALRVSTLGPAHPLIADSYAATGIMYTRLGDFDKAIALQQKAIQILEGALGADHPNTLVNYIYLGAVHSSRGHHDKALQVYDKALKSNLSVFGPEHQRIGGLYSMIGETHSWLENYSEAAKYHERALKILLASPQSEAIQAAVSHSYTYGGRAQRALGNHEAALKLHEGALEVSLKFFSPESTDVAVAYLDMGIEHAHLGRTAEALELYHRALRIEQNVPKPDDSLLATIYTYIGDAHDAFKDYDKAIQTYTQGLRLAQGVSDEHNTENLISRLKDLCEAGHPTACDIR